MNNITRYSEKELKEFEAIILDKLEKAKEELRTLKRSIIKKNEDSGDSATHIKTLEDGADTLEKEKLNQLALRQQKFIKHLENALFRINNGTYGVCVETGKLISKERLRAVPHTTHSIEAKRNKLN